MPRRQRHWLKGGCYHITHRCLDSNFFFLPAYERDIYISELFEARKRYKFDVLNYIVTSNHIHLLVYCRNGRELEKSIQYVHGRVGQYYNVRHNRKGSFWSDRFHAVLIESGEHLSECMYYIDYNMMRNGVVAPPREWKHSGYHELIGMRKRYRLINFSRLLKCLDINDHEQFREWYSKTIDSKAESYMERQGFWTEAAVVGSWNWINAISTKIGIKRRTKVEKIKKRVVYSVDDNSDKIIPQVSDLESVYYAIR